MGKPNEQQKAYIAGFVDGEGCICLARNRQTVRLVIRISQGGKAPLEFIRKFYCGALNVQNNKVGSFSSRPCFALVIQQEQGVAKSLLEDILPYSIVKRNQIKLALKYLEFKNSVKLALRAKPPYNLLLDEFRLEMRRLNGWSGGGAGRGA